MGREVRMVPEGWEHPVDTRPGYSGYLPLHDGFNERLAELEKRIETHGLRDAIDYFGGGPLEENYMLVDVPDEERTHYMMYEDTTEGTPISPAFETPEELARWLADNGASAFGSHPASYEAWLSTIRRGSALSAFFMPGAGVISGVEAEHEELG